MKPESVTVLLAVLGILAAVSVGITIDGFAHSGSMWNPIVMVVEGERVPFHLPWSTYPIAAVTLGLYFHFTSRRKGD